MKKYNKQSIIIILITILIFTFTNTVLASTDLNYSDSNSNNDIFEFNLSDLEYNLNDLNSDGITIIFLRNEDDSFSRFVVKDSKELLNECKAASNLYSFNDGKLEFATFHLGFNHWNNDTGRLYFEVNSDEPLSRVSGQAYVKSLSKLNEKIFYNHSFAKSVNGLYHVTQTLQENVHTGQEKEVRVGFSNVYLRLLTGYSQSLGAGSEVVKR